MWRPVLLFNLGGATKKKFCIESRKKDWKIEFPNSGHLCSVLSVRKKSERWHKVQSFSNQSCVKSSIHIFFVNGNFLKIIFFNLLLLFFTLVCFQQVSKFKKLWLAHSWNFKETEWMYMMILYSCLSYP